MAKISQLTQAKVYSPDMLIPVELFGQTLVMSTELLKGMDGTDSEILAVYSDRGTVILNGEGQRTLTARVFRGGREITHLFPSAAFSWSRVSRRPDDDEIWTSLHDGCGPVITVTAQEIIRQAMFQCDVDLGAELPEDAV